MFLILVALFVNYISILIKKDAVDLPPDDLKRFMLTMDIIRYSIIGLVLLVVVFLN